MTRKDFELIAAVLKDGYRDDADGYNVFEDEVAAHNKAVTALALDFATKLATTNPGFDRARFLRAAGVEV